MKLYIGIDVGGTKTYCGLITEKGDILRTKEVPSRVPEGNDAIITTLTDVIEEVARGAKFSGIGIGLAGHIDHVRNRIIDAGPNFLPSFASLKLAPHFVDRYNVPVVLENDAKVYALGEAIFGRGKGYRRVVTVTVGTGIGGGIVQDGLIVHGKNNLAGEVGQMFTRSASKTWERLAAGGPFNRHGNIKKEAELLADGFANILNVLDPDVLVVGGGVSREPNLIETAKKLTRLRLHYTSLMSTPIVKSSLVRNAPILGAMLRVRG